MRSRPFRTTTAALTAALLTTACSAAEPVALPTPSPVAAPEPTPTPPATVAVDMTASTLSLADDDVLTKRTGRLPLDAEAVAAATERMTRLLITHLDDLNAGRPGQLADLAVPGLLEQDATVADRLDAGLADPTTFATDLQLALRFGADGAPRWVEADLDVLRIDGSRVRLDLVFTIGDELQLVLVSIPDDEVAA